MSDKPEFKIGDKFDIPMMVTNIEDEDGEYLFEISSVSALGITDDSITGHVYANDIKEMTDKHYAERVKQSKIASLEKQLAKLKGEDNGD